MFPAGSTLRDVTEGVGLVANERTLACACLADRLLLQVMHKRMQLFTMDAALAPDQGTLTSPVQQAIPHTIQPTANVNQYQTSTNAVHQPLPNIKQYCSPTNTVHQPILYFSAPIPYINQCHTSNNTVHPPIPYTNQYIMLYFVTLFYNVLYGVHA